MTLQASQQTHSGARLFVAMPEFKRLVLRPGGPPRATALRRAEENIRSMTGDLILAMRQDIDRLTVTISKTEGDARALAAESTAARLIDVAATIGYRRVAAVASSLRILCEQGRQAGDLDTDMLEAHVAELRIGIRAQPV